MLVAGLTAVQEEELGQGEESVTIEDVTNNPAAQVNLDNTHDQNIVEPDPDGHALVRFPSPSSPPPLFFCHACSLQKGNLESAPRMH